MIVICLVILLIDNSNCKKRSKNIAKTERKRSYSDVNTHHRGNKVILWFYDGVIKCVFQKKNVEGNYEATYKNSRGAKGKTNTNKKEKERSKNKKEKSSWYTIPSNFIKGMAFDYIADSIWEILPLA